MIKYLSVRFTVALILLDVAIVVVALLLSTMLRLNVPLGTPGAPEAFFIPVPVYIFAVIIYLLTFALFDARSPRHIVQPVRELQVITSASLIAWLTLLGAIYLSYRNVSRLQIIYFFVLQLMLVIGSRLAIRTFYIKRKRYYTATRNVLIIGSSDVARRMYRIVMQHMWMGLRPVGLVSLPAEPQTTNAHVIGTIDDIESIVTDNHVSEVVFAIERDTRLDLKHLMLRLQALPVNIRLVPEYTDLAFLQVNVENFSGIPLLTLKEPVLTPYQRFHKRIFDVIVTLIILVPTLPLMAIIALCIKLDSRGPVFFLQKRVGEGGKPFTMFKFRSMVHGVAWKQEEIVAYDENGNPLHKHPNDPRVTRVGRFLRRTSLDELPQLFNILMGDMSLVGPRPEMPELVDRYEEWQRKRFEVPQGLTGWWQVNGRSTKPMHLSTEYDLFYIRNYSIWLDVQILGRTVWTVLSRKGAF